MNILHLLNQIRIERLSKRTSYSQCGEDLIISNIFSSLKILKPRYLDIGANHPASLNNTYYFYLRGSRGVCVEPDPSVFKQLKHWRTKDVCLNVGVGVDNQKEADFYIMSTNLLNTFSKDTAQEYQRYGTYKIKKIIKIPLLKINDIVKQYLSDSVNLISIDIEGLELEVLQTFDFVIRPEVFCIETLSYSENKLEQKNREVIDYMIDNGYFVYADTYINTVFVDKKSWNER